MEIISVLVAAGDGEDAGADHIGEPVHNAAGSRWSGNIRASFSARPRRRSASDRSTTPPSDVSWPPSNAAVIFLQQTAGK
jgi:hypothetical protein